MRFFRKVFTENAHNRSKNSSECPGMDIKRGGLFARPIIFPAIIIISILLIFFINIPNANNGNKPVETSTESRETEAARRNMPQNSFSSPGKLKEGKTDKQGMVPDKNIKGNSPYFLGPELRSPPEKIVSLSPALTEIMTAIEATSLLAGITRFCNHPELSGIRNIGGYLDPSIEAILSTEPDLLLVEPSPGNYAPVKRLAELGIPVLVIPHGGIRETRKAIISVAEISGRADKGITVIMKMDSVLDKVKKTAAGKEPVDAAIIYGRNPLVLAGPGSFGDEILELAGGRNIARDAGTPYPAYPHELLAAKSPEVVIEVEMSGSVTGIPFSFLPQTRHEVIRGDAILRPGPRLGEAALQIQLALYPDPENKK